MGHCHSMPHPNPVGTNTFLSDKIKGDHFCAPTGALPINIIADALLPEVAIPFLTGATAFAVAGGGRAAIMEGRIVPSSLDDKINKSNLFGMNSSRIDYCNGIGDKGEWYYNGENGGDCHFNSLHNTTQFNGSVCCDGQCPIIGEGVVCERANYLGNPIVCCFNDYECSGNFDDGFQTPARMRTCSKELRNLGSSTCRDVVMNVCGGDVLLEGETDFTQLWVPEGNVPINLGFERGIEYPMYMKNQPCVRALYRGIYGDAGCGMNLDSPDIGSVGFDPEGYEWGKKLVNKVILNYNQRSTGIFKTIDSDGYMDQSMYNVIQTICTKDPGLCKNTLSELCSTLTKKDLVDNPNALSWCGCYLNNDIYYEYTNIYGVQKECTPFCNRPNIIPSVDEDDRPIYCQQSTCIIDDISIKLALSSNGYGEGQIGNLNFTQICPGCGSCNVMRKIGSNEENNEVGNVNMEEDKKYLFSTSFIPLDKKEKKYTYIADLKSMGKNQNTEVNLERCRCHLSGSIVDLNSKIGSANILQNCGGTKCYDSYGNITDCNSTKTVIKPQTETGNGSIVIDPNEDQNKEKERKITYSIMIIIFVLFSFFVLFLIKKK